MYKGLPEVRERIKKLLDPTDFETDNAFRSWNHCEGTGNWLLSEPTYVLWEKMLPTEDLWLHGDPGSGKTYLMSKVVERIHQRHKSGAAIAFFFCDNKTESSQRRSTSAVLRTLVSQLLLGILPRHADDVETCLQELAKYGKNDEMMPWLFQEILKTISKHLPRVFLIIDAIDECDDVAELLHVLKDLRTLTTKFHIMISSRGWISSLLSSLAISVHGIVLSLERVKPDIKTFILSKIPCLHIRDIRSEGEVTRRLTDGCDSLFLLAHFYVKSLRRNPPQDLDEALDALPEDLMQFYGKVMNQIQNLPVYQRTRVRKVFMWVIFAKRQLNFGELVGVVYATSRNQQSFQDRGREITQQQLDELCGGLLTFRSGNDPDPSETIIELTHKTVKECVADFVWNTTPPSPSLSDQSACTLEILRMAISYMYNLKTPDRVKNRFLDYVYNFWILHLFDTKTPDRNLAKDVVRFLDSEECYAWWDSPTSAPLNGTADARRNLQSHFQRWVTTNSSLTSRLRRRMYFMTKLQEKQVASYSNLKGKDHLETLAVSGKLGETYRQRGLLKSALKVEKGVWDAYVAVQGADHPQSVIAGNNLANTYAAQGLWSKAEEIHMRRMEACVRLRGRYHLHTLAAATQLARVYKGALQSLRAEVLQFEVVTTSEKILGSNHTNTLQAMGDLAKTYKRQGRFEKSVNLYQEVLAAFKTYRGEDHPETLKAACDLAGAHAICSLKEMIADFAVVDLSDILQIRGLVKIRADNTLALELQEHAVTALKRVLGEFHLETLVASCDLACIHLLRGEWEKATILFEQVLAIREDILGSSHPLSIFSRVQAAAGHLLQGNFVKSVRHASISAAMACNCSINYVPNLRDIHGETLVLKWIQLKVKGVTLSIPDPSTVRAPECGVVVFGENLLDYGVLGFSMGLVLFLSLVCEEVQGLPDVFSVFDRFLV
ncbi:hypothetical protein Q9L58_000366 [Maublancomyces gigas]|uniref:NACHT domain-containing protein n=1 Tax=Discina gigas TaxID=1032678 RepID=A0ABR3GXS2_9PEZI